MKRYAWLMLGGAAAWGLNTWAFGMADVDALCIALVCLWAAGGWIFRKKGTEVLLAGGFVAALVFVLKLPYTFSWHDLASYSADFSGAAKPDGHLGYIAWLVEHGTLPLQDPRIDGYSVFYNPPLYHILQALFMKLNLLLGVSQEAALENLQIVTMLCACGCMLVTADLLRALGADEKAVRRGVVLVAFQPMILLLGATLNNDILSVFLVLMCVLFTVRWQQSRRMGDILGAGVTLGLGMAVKLSIAVIIPCIAVVFAAAFFRDLPRWKKYLGQFAAFLAVSVPEAVAWPLFHMIAYQMPLSYVRLPAETINVGHYTLWQRFGFPNHDAIRGLFYSPTRSINHNVWMQTLKTGMFDELTLFAEGTVMWYVTYASLVLFAAVLLGALVLFVRLLQKKHARIDGMTKVFLAAYGAMLIGSYLSFCIQYPYICTFNFRYIAPVLALCAAAYAAYAQERPWVGIVTGGYAALSMAVYGVYFFG